MGNKCMFTGIDFIFIAAERKVLPTDWTSFQRKIALTDIGNVVITIFHSLQSRCYKPFKNTAFMEYVIAILICRP